jgi:NAD+ kinase
VEQRPPLPDSAGRPQPASELHQLGLVVHPSRPVEGALEQIAAWASAHGLTVGEVAVAGQTRRLADSVEPADCDLLLALGGDGTALRALHTGAPTGRPALGVALGSIGVLTSVSAERLPWALEQVAAGRWSRVAVPALDLAWGGAHAAAINDLAILRDGPGQAIVSITVDGVLYARVAGDGLVIGTALGSSAYTMAAGGPLLAPGAEAMVITPLADHGGSCPPLVAGNASVVTVAVEPGHSGVRFEVDGRPTAAVEKRLITVSHRPDYATLVALAEEEPRLTGLRRRGLVLDSPRVLVRETRSASEHPP